MGPFTYLEWGPVPETLMRTGSLPQEGDLGLSASGPCLPTRGMLWSLGLPLMGPGRHLRHKRNPKSSSSINSVCLLIE